MVDEIVSTHESAVAKHKEFQLLVALKGKGPPGSPRGDEVGRDGTYSSSERWRQLVLLNQPINSAGMEKAHAGHVE